MCNVVIDKRTLRNIFSTSMEVPGMTLFRWLAMRVREKPQVHGMQLERPGAFGGQAGESPLDKADILPQRPQADSRGWSSEVLDAVAVILVVVGVVLMGRWLAAITYWLLEVFLTLLGGICAAAALSNMIDTVRQKREWEVMLSLSLLGFTVACALLARHVVPYAFGMPTPPWLFPPIS